MKYVFLDIDGVLNNDIMYHPGYDNKFKDESYPICLFDSNCVDKINRVFSETGAKFVLSSSWRADSTETLQHIFSKVGLPINFDKTPMFNFRYLSDDNDDYCRGDEIKEYLDNHPEVDNYVIIDDDNDMLPSQMEHFVKCNPWYGLTDKDVDKIIEILNK